MYAACSTTARRGALDWAPIFEKANVPIFEQLYESVKNGTETRKSLEFNGRSTYREDLTKELEAINNQEIWRAGKHLNHCHPLSISDVLFQARSSVRCALISNPTLSSRLFVSYNAKASIWCTSHVYPIMTGCRQS